jgi:hypothetical protein
VTFKKEASGIESVKGVQTIDIQTPMYNMAGQRVADGYKGLVIMNGKKVVMK